jgi:hypothetical protein
MDNPADKKIQMIKKATARSTPNPLSQGWKKKPARGQVFWND